MAGYLELSYIKTIKFYLHLPDIYFLFSSSGMFLIRLVPRFLGRSWQKEPLSAHLCCSKKIPPTKCLINNRNLLLIVWETKESKIKVPAELVVSSKSPLPIQPSSGWNVTRWKGLQSFWVSSIRSVIPFLRFHPHDWITSQRPHLQIPSSGGWDFNIWTVEEI